MARFYKNGIEVFFETKNDMVLFHLGDQIEISNEHGLIRKSITQWYMEWIPVYKRMYHASDDTLSRFLIYLGKKNSFRFNNFFDNTFNLDLFFCMEAIKSRMQLTEIIPNVFPNNEFKNKTIIDQTTFTYETETFTVNDDWSVTLCAQFDPKVAMMQGMHSYPSSIISFIKRSNKHASVSMELNNTGKCVYTFKFDNPKKVSRFIKTVEKYEKYTNVATFFANMEHI